MQAKRKLPQKKTRSVYRTAGQGNQASKAKPTDDPTTPFPLTTTHFK
jgi:hypothetical protein